MSDYTPITAFGPKDALATGTPAKLIKGVEFDAEFSAISTAIVSKLEIADFANPTGLVGLAAVNGVAITLMRSDAAPALSQSISPTWTGAHTFTATVKLSNLSIVQQWEATGAPLDQKLWRAAISTTGVFSIDTLTDAGAFGANALVFSRSGTAVSSIALSATTVTVNGQNVRDAALFTSGTLPVVRGGTGTTTSTGTGSVVLSASPTLSGTITGGTFSGAHTGDGSGLTGLDAADISAGTLAIGRGGTGQTDGTARNITGKAGVAKTLSSLAPSGGSDGDIWYRF